VACPDFEGICSADIYPIRPRKGQVSREFLALLAFQLKLPPFTDQLRFDAIAKRIREMKKDRLSASKVAESCFGALVQQAFRGEL
jgi:type I restriction enzyme S subunit